MTKILKLLKYLEYIELFESIGNAIRATKAGDDWIVEKDVRIKGRHKQVRIICSDIENETGEAIYHTEG